MTTVNKPTRAAHAPLWTSLWACSWAALLLCAYLPLNAAAQQTDAPDGEVVELDRIVAVVNDDVVTQNELDTRIDKVRDELSVKGIPPPPGAALEKQVLERLILQRLQLQEAARAGIRVDDQALNRAVQRIADNNRLSVRQFRDLLARDGVGFPQFREEVRNEILISRIRSKQIGGRVKVSEQEIEYLLENIKNRGGLANRYRLAHILVAIPEGSTPDEIETYRAEMADIVAELAGGADFARMAASYSDAQTALDGGDLGWRSRGELPSAFEDIVPAMAVGEVSDIIRTPGGLHLIKLLDTDGDRQVVLTETKARHILIKPNQIISATEARSRIEQLRRRVLSGEDFAALARANSDDTASAVDGGDLGWVKPGKLTPEFEDVMDATTVGAVSEPFSTPFGWHILRVDDRRQYDGTEEYLRSQVGEMIRKRKAEEEQVLWLRRLRDGAYIEFVPREPV